jgi:hypothetical protein
VGPENLNPLDELKFLDQQVDQVTDLAGLKPIFSRVDEIGREHSGDFEVQLAVSEIKQRVVARGTALKHAQAQETAGVAESPQTQKFPAAPPPQTTQPLEATGHISTGQTQAPAVPPSFRPPPELPATTVSRTPPAPPATGSWKRALIMGAIAGAVVAIALIVVLVNQARKRNLAAAVQVQVATTPPGASIRINGETKCDSNCTVALTPGDYQLTAFLDGYEPAASAVKVAARQPASVNLRLQPRAQMLRILTDLAQGKVIVDGQPPAELQDGQFVINNVEPGMHTVKVMSKNGEASFTVETAAANPPAIAGPVTAKNLLAVLVSSLGSKARVVTNHPMKLALNGQPQADATPAGVDLSGFQPGVDEIVVGEGQDQHSMSESFGPAPMLTAFLKSDLNIGTLIVSTGEDGARVFLNGKEYARKTQRGQVRIQTIGNVSVRVAKDGFEMGPPQTAQVKKGSEVRLEFKMQPLPQVAVLQIRGGTPGAEVLVDQKTLGTVGDDGTFTGRAVPAGDHIVELRRDQYVPKRLRRQFVAGQTVALLGDDVVLAAAVGTVRLTRTPADAAVVYRRADETQAHDLRGNQVELPPGNYIFTAKAPGFSDKTERVQVAAGETRPVELALARVVVAPPPTPKIAGIADFEDPNAWSKQGDLWTHKGGGFIPYKLPANGTFTFTVKLLRGGGLFRGGRIRWALQYVDGRNYDLFELDRNNLSSKVIEAGETYDRGKFEHGLNNKDMAFTVQIEVAPGLLVHRLQNGDNWLVLDTWKEPGRNFAQGKFAFLVQGNDEIGISDFKFTPR